jgi:Cdc6-like AAA superfamily ATPase
MKGNYNMRNTIKNYRIVFEDYDHNELYGRIREFKNKKEASKYAKEIIATTSDDSKYFRIIKL